MTGNAPSRKSLLATLLIGLVVWATVTWPLPLHFSSAIPFTGSRAPGEAAVTATVPGDHLQLLYHFWLCRDMLAGGTPAFSNVYEFNVDGDAATRRFDTYYVPFSLVYAIVSPLFGHAAGWNAAGLFSHLLGLFGILLLARRLSRSDAAAVAITLGASAFPYRWATLLHGSPTGFAFCFAPWVLYGIDRLVRDASAAGSAIAGAALLLAYCSDLHVFYFAALSLPFACVVSALLRDAASAAPTRVMRAAAPLAACVVAAVALSRLASAGLGKTAMAGGRSLREVKTYSPVLAGLFSYRSLQGTTNQIFIGAAAVAALAGAALRLVLAAPPSRREWRRYAAAALLALAFLAILLLAAGAYGPFDALPLRIARKLVPKYTMIRQTAKIFCILPAFLAFLAALAFAPPAAETPAPAAGRRRAVSVLGALCAALAAGAALEQSSRFSPRLCRIPAPATAYVAAMADAAARTPSLPRPKAVCLPLWPGDSHWSSLYEHGAMQTRLRLVNGYSPAVPQGYFEKVFKPLESLNQGSADFAQYRLLRERGVDYVLFHEQTYPRNVSPFPAGVALDALVESPWLEPIAHAGGVAAFRIRDNLREEDFKAAPATGTERSCLDFPASFIWAGRTLRRSLETAPAGRINLTLRAPVVMRPAMRFLVLDAANGWREIPLDNPMGGVYPLPDGVASPQCVVLTAGRAPDQAARQLEIVPARLFHKGSGEADGGVAFAGDTLQPGRIMEGPNLPLPPGKWRLTVKAEGAAPGCASLEAGFLDLPDRPGGTIQTAFAPTDDAGKWNNGSPGSSASIDLDVKPDSPPFSLAVTAKQPRDMAIRSITLERSR